jgi:hypothetical protein
VASATPSASAKPKESLKEPADLPVLEMRRTLERAEKDGDLPTIAIARCLLAIEIDALQRTEPKPERYDEIVRLVSDAMRDWPALEDNTGLSTLALSAAVARSAPKDVLDSLGGASKSINNSPSVTLHAILASGHANTLIPVYRKDSCFEEASKRLRKLESGGALIGWELARVFDDAVWRKKAACGVKAGVDLKDLEEQAQRSPDSPVAKRLPAIREALKECE